MKDMGPVAHFEMPYEDRMRMMDLIIRPLPMQGGYS